MNDQERRIVAKCEEYGPEKVRRYITTGKWIGQNAKYAQAWLERYDRAQEDAARSVQMASALSSNDLAREANEIARSANALASAANAIAERARRHARIANVIALLAAAISIAAVIVAALRG